MVSRKTQLAPIVTYNNSTGKGNVAGTANPKKWIVVHQTGNPDNGANAQAHADLQTNNYGVDRNVSWHWTVDDKEAVQSFAHNVQCFHASDGFTVDGGNMAGIAVEICINEDGDYNKAVRHGAQLVRWICDTEKIPYANIKQHYDFAPNKKNCPEQIRAGKNGIGWNEFLNLVITNYSQVTLLGHANRFSPSSGSELIPHWAIGQTFDASQVRPINYSYSDREYLLMYNGQIWRWILSQDIVGGVGSDKVT